MVECEFIIRKGASQMRSSFNRYMVECESIPLTSTGYVRRVLIDTWWNVNDEYLLAHTNIVKF